MSGAKAAGEFSQFTAESKCGPASQLSDDLNIMPGNPVSQARAGRLHSRLFGGKAGRQPLSGVQLGNAVADLIRSEDPSQKTLAKALPSRLDPGDLSDINSRAYNHLRHSKVPQPLSLYGCRGGIFARDNSGQCEYNVPAVFEKRCTAVLHPSTPACTT